MAKSTPTPVGVTTPANAGASNKSAPAPTPAVPEGFKKWLWLAMVATVIVGTIVLIASVARDKNHEQKSEKAMLSAPTIPLASSPQSLWPKLVIPPGGKSEIIPLPSGMRVIWAGYQFRNYTLYPDGHECAFNGTTPCPNGGTGTYANNETNVVNVVAYAFDPI